jgi:actin-related protein
MGVKSSIGGKLIRNYLIKLYKNEHPYLHSPMFEPIITKIIHEKTQLALNINDALSNPNNDAVQLEEIEIAQLEETLKLGIEKYLGPEILFHPQLINSTHNSIDGLIIQSLRECHPSLRQKIYSNIVFAGGCSSFPNLPERLTQIFSTIPLLAQSSIFIHPQPNLTVWKGMQVIVNSTYYAKNAKSQADFFAKL